MLWVLAAASAEPMAAVEQLMNHHDQRALDSAPSLERGVFERALQGELVTGLVEVPDHRARVAWGLRVVDQPIDRYWAAVNDDRSKTAYTKLEHLELLDGSYCSAHRLVFQYLPITMLSDRWWVVDLTQNTPLSSATSGVVREVAWKSRSGYGDKLPESAKSWAERGMELPFTEGSWTLVDLGDGRTLVQFYTWSDPGGNVPARLASGFAEGGIGDTITSMNALAKKGPTCLKG